MELKSVGMPNDSEANLPKPIEHLVLSDMGQKLRLAK
jgi:hypothetical protein